MARAPLDALRDVDHIWAMPPESELRALWAALDADGEVHDGTPAALDSAATIAPTLDPRGTRALVETMLSVGVRLWARRRAKPDDRLTRAVDEALGPLADWFVARLDGDDPQDRVEAAGFLGNVRSRRDRIVERLCARLAVEDHDEVLVFLLLSLREQGAFDPHASALYEASLRHTDAYVASAAALALRDAGRVRALTAESRALVERALTPMQLKLLAQMASDFYGLQAEPEKAPAAAGVPATLEDATVVFASGSTLLVAHTTRGNFRFQLDPTGLERGDLVRIGDFVDAGTLPRALELECTPRGKATTRIRFDTSGRATSFTPSA